MALEILNAKKVAANGLLSKIQIGGQTYELKDLIARESIEALSSAIDALSYVAYTGVYADDAAIKAAIEAGDKALGELITALEAKVDKKADAEQVVKDIAAAVAAEAEIARAAEKKNADDIIAINAVLNTIDDEDSITSLKELAIWVEEHGTEAAEMAKSITANAEAIAKEVEDRANADSAIDERLSAVEEMLDGEGSVASQIEAAKNAAIEAANQYTDAEDAKIKLKVAQKEDKANLKALAYADSATGTVAGQTITGVKATGTSAGSIVVELEQSEHAMNSTGKYTPAGNVAGSVTVASHNVPVTLSHSTENATLTKGDYTPAGDVAVTLAGGSFNAITGVGTQASFQEGAFTAATLDSSDVTANYAKEGIVGTVNDDECLVFTAAGIEAITATKVNSFNGGSKAADVFVANSLPTMAAHTVGVESSTFTGTKATDLVVTNVSYSKATDGNGTCAGGTYDIDASFTGTEGDVAVAGLCHDYAVKTAQFNGAAIELAVGDIAVAAKDVTVQ